MKNEIFLRAMGDIDDDLIVAAQQTAPAKHVPWRRIGAVAACLLLLCGIFLFGQLKPLPDVSLYGQTIPSGEPLPIAGPDTAALEPHGKQIPDTLSIPLTITVQGVITAETGPDDGTLTLYEQQAPVETGHTLTLDGSTDIVWQIAEPDPDHRYQLTLDGGRLILTVYWDTETGTWFLTK